MAAAVPFVAVAATLLSVGVQVQAGKASAKEAELEAQVAELGATQREADRKDALARALATANAQAGAAGIRAFEGSPLTIATESIQAERTTSERDLFNTRISALTTRARGRTAQTSANIGAASSLLRGTTQAAQLVPE